MPDNIALYVLLVVALGIGFLLGRRERRAPERKSARDYFRGLNHLLNDGNDLALDSFVEAIAVDYDTVDTHLALGSLVRRRGEVDKAIRIHQNLLARPVLSHSHRTQTEVELARDYLAAGLLGRAENLLLELVQQDRAAKPIAQEMLMEIYERESDWAKAAEVGEQLLRTGQPVRAKLAHFQCERAEAALAAGDLREARALVNQGGDFDPGCARVNLVAGKLELAAGRYRDAKKRLRKARSQDPDLAAETLDLYRAACQADERAYRDYLQECLAEGPALQVVEVLGGLVEQEQGAQAARTFMMEQLLRNPSLGGFVMLLDRLQRDGEPLEMEQLAMLRRFSQSLLAKQFSFRCGECGFSGHTLLWLCPSCRTWGSIKPIVHRHVA